MDQNKYYSYWETYDYICNDKVEEVWASIWFWLYNNDAFELIDDILMGEYQNFPRPTLARTDPILIKLNYNDEKCLKKAILSSIEDIKLSYEEKLRDRE